MRQASNGRGRQLSLCLEPEVEYRLTKETHEALIPALAELLLEAYGEEAGEVAVAPGGDDEPEDHA